MTSRLEQMAYGFATSQMISTFGDTEGTWYDRYLYLCESVGNDEDPDGWVAWQPFEHWEWKDILDQIESEALAILSNFKDLLDLAKKGIVQSAIDCTLDSDMNLIDMESMVELGAQQGGIAGAALSCTTSDSESDKSEGEAAKNELCFVLRDGEDYSNDDKAVKVSVKSLGHALCIKIDGYSDCCSVDSKGIPVCLDNYSGEIKLLVYSDINEEEPTHSISLSGARNQMRKE